VHLCEEVFESAGGLGWLSTNLTDRDRSVAVIAALVTQDVTDQRLATYLSLARRTESTSTWPPS
jgi:4-carboxymuconolactone decarboxylase